MTVPALQKQQQGISQVSADNYNTYVQTANVVSDLRAFIGISGMKTHMSGYTSPNDGGQGVFYWNATGTGPDDNGVTNIVPTGVVIGCWTRISATAVGNGTVTNISVVSANGVSATIATPTTTPAITIILGAITPSSVAATGTVTGSNLTGTNTGDQTITLTGQVTGSGTGSFATTLATNTVSNAQFRQSASLSVVGNASGATANVADIIGIANQIMSVNAAGTALGFQSTMDNVTIGGTTPAAGTFTAVNSSGNITMTTANRGLVLKQGANGKCGTFVANGVTPVSISNSSIALTDTICYDLNTAGGTVGAAPVTKTKTAGTGFTVVAAASDTSTYNYVIISNGA